jgi:DNA-binding MarR family transcriptional regulator
MRNAIKYSEHDLLSVEGQLAILLLKSERSASEIYANISASQPTVSKKIARMLDLGMIEVKSPSGDRRVSIYCVTEGFRSFLAQADAIRVMAEIVL